MNRTHTPLPGHDTRAVPYVSRRRLLRTGVTAGLVATVYAATGQMKIHASVQGGVLSNTNGRNVAMASTMNVVLVHGAFADASSWSGVISRLQQAGYGVTAVQNPLTSLADDIATTRRVIDAIPGPVVLVGHSYGGAVISAAGTAPNVKSLVYIAAFAPDEGETLIDLNMRFPALESVKHYRPDAAGFLSIAPETFPQDFAADVDPVQAQVMAVTQKPIAGASFATKVGTPAWHTLPTFYQVSENDAMIQPDLERFLAARIKATTISLPASHAAMVSHPAEIAQLIMTAAQAS